LDGSHSLYLVIQAQQEHHQQLNWQGLVEPLELELKLEEL